MELLPAHLQVSTLEFDHWLPLEDRRLGWLMPWPITAGRDLRMSLADHLHFAGGGERDIRGPVRGTGSRGHGVQLELESGSLNSALASLGLDNLLSTPLRQRHGFYGRD